MKLLVKIVIFTQVFTLAGNLYPLRHNVLRDFAHSFTRLNNLN